MYVVEKDDSKEKFRSCFLKKDDDKKGSIALLLCQRISKFDFSTPQNRCHELEFSDDCVQTKYKIIKSNSKVKTPVQYFL
jgi:hypothetical protein